MVDDELVNFSYVDMWKELRAERERDFCFLQDANRKPFVELDVGSLESGFFRKGKLYRRGDQVKSFSYEAGNVFRKALNVVLRDVWYKNYLMEREKKYGAMGRYFVQDEKSMDYIRAEHEVVLKFYENKGIKGVSGKIDAIKVKLDNKIGFLNEIMESKKYRFL